MINLIDFNINHRVHVRLTDKGRQILRENHDELYSSWTTKPDYIEVHEDKEGWSIWQMHELMSELGGKHIFGMNLPFETNIKIEEIK